MNLWFQVIPAAIAILAVASGCGKATLEKQAERRGWMSSFRPPDDAMAHREAMTKLENSQAEPERIQGNLNRALASAASILTRSSHRLH